MYRLHSYHCAIANVGRKSKLQHADRHVQLEHAQCKRIHCEKAGFWRASLPCQLYSPPFSVPGGMMRLESMAAVDRTGL